MIEQTSIMLAMYWQIVFLLIAGGLFLFGLACLIFASERFLTVAIVEVKRQIASSANIPGRFPGVGADLEKSMQEFWKKRLTPTEGGFDPYNEEEMWVREKAEELKAVGALDDKMSDAEMVAFVKESLRASGMGEKPAGE